MKWRQAALSDALLLVAHVSDDDDGSPDVNQASMLKMSTNRFFILATGWSCCFR